MTAKTEVVTPDMIRKIIDAVEQVAAARFGEVVIVVERGVPRWVRPAPSIELSEPPQDIGDKR